MSKRLGWEILAMSTKMQIYASFADAMTKMEKIMDHWDI
jgi:hypothetical protein